MADRPVGEIIQGITDDAKLLVSDTVELAKTEIIPSAKNAGIGAGLFGAAGYFGINALTLLYIAAALGLVRPRGDALVGLRDRGRGAAARGRRAGPDRLHPGQEGQGTGEDDRPGSGVGGRDQRRRQAGHRRRPGTPDRGSGRRDQRPCPEPACSPNVGSQGTARAGSSASIRSVDNSRHPTSSATAKASAAIPKPTAIAPAIRSGRRTLGARALDAQHDRAHHGDPDRAAELPDGLHQPGALRPLRRRDPAQRVGVGRRDGQAEAEPGQDHPRHLPRVVDQVGNAAVQRDQADRADRQPDQHRAAARRSGRTSGHRSAPRR